MPQPHRDMTISSNGVTYGINTVMYKVWTLTLLTRLLATSWRQTFSAGSSTVSETQGGECAMLSLTGPEQQRLCCRAHGL